MFRFVSWRGECRKCFKSKEGSVDVRYRGESNQSVFNDRQVKRKDKWYMKSRSGNSRAQGKFSVVKRRLAAKKVGRLVFEKSVEADACGVGWVSRSESVLRGKRKHGIDSKHQRDREERGREERIGIDARNEGIKKSRNGTASSSRTRQESQRGEEEAEKRKRGEEKKHDMT